MRREIIEDYIIRDMLRKREPDFARARSLVESAQTTAEVAIKVPLDENSATMIFREIYESIRQIGDAVWWTRGFEARSHEPSTEVIKDLLVDKSKGASVDRFRRIRNDANYRGYKVTPAQALDILDFWKVCGKELLNSVKKMVK